MCFLCPRRQGAVLATAACFRTQAPWQVRNHPCSAVKMSGHCCNSSAVNRRGAQVPSPHGDCGTILASFPQVSLRPLLRVPDTFWDSSHQTPGLPTLSKGSGNAGSVRHTHFTKVSSIGILLRIHFCQHHFLKSCFIGEWQTSHLNRTSLWKHFSGV